MKGAIKKLFIVIGVIAVACVALWLSSLRPVDNFNDKYAGVDLSMDAEGAMLEGTYTGYQEEHKDAAEPQKEVTVDLYNYTAKDDVEVYNDYMGEEKA